MDADDWILLHLIESRVTEEKQGRRVTEVLKKGQEIRRKCRSIERGNLGRLPWSDESPRSALVSRFVARGIED